MTDENRSSANEGNNQVDVQKLQDELKSMADRIEAMDRKNRELLDEKKKKDEEARIASEELEKERLKKAGDLDKLLEIEQQKTAQAIKDKQDLLNEIRLEKIQSLALKLANEMKGRPESIEILANCVSQEISSLVDEKGNLSDAKRSSIVEKFKDSAKYKPLLLGNQSTGGSAEGSGGSSTNSFDEMSEKEQVELYKSDPAKWRQLKASSGK